MGLPPAAALSKSATSTTAATAPLTRIATTTAALRATAALARAALTLRGLFRACREWRVRETLEFQFRNCLANEALDRTHIIPVFRTD
jgi:hypothetical protein